MRDVIEERLRLNSAGSGRNSHSAGSQHSIKLETSSTLPPSSSVPRPTESSNLVSVLDESGPVDPPLDHHSSLATRDGLDNNVETIAGQPSGSIISGDIGERRVNEETKDVQMFEVAMVLGGMDTEGEIFEDCLVMMLRNVSDQLMSN